MIRDLQDTIVAVASPIGEGAISVIRMSGSMAVEIASRQFFGNYNLRDVKSHSAHFGRINDKSGNIIDEVVCTIFKGPSRTQERILLK